MLRRLALLSTLFVPLVVGAAPSSGPTWSPRVHVATGEGVRGEWKQNESDFRYVDDATVALDGKGDAIVAWVDQAKKDVFVQRYGRDGQARFATASNASQSPTTFSWLPRVVVDGDEVLVVWQEIIFSGGSHGGEILFARSRDGGRTFDGAFNLSNSVEGDGKGRLSEKVWHNGSLAFARNERGALFVAWTNYEGALFLRRSFDGGKSFTAAHRLNGSKASPARAPSLAVRGDRVALAWAVGESDAADIWYASSRDAGHAFGKPFRANESEGHSDAPNLAVDETGTVHLVYAEKPRDAERYELRYTRLRGAAFEAPRKLPAVNDRAEAGHFPALAIDGGRIHVLWEQHADRSPRPESLGYAVSIDGGDHFSPALRVPHVAGHGWNGSQQGLSDKLAARGGELAIVNSTFKSGERSDIWLLRAR